VAEEIEKERTVPVWRRKIVVAGGVALVLVVIGALIWNFYLRHPTKEVASVEEIAHPLPDKPSIAVLPFDNLSEEPEQEYFADGMTDDLITDLSKISGLFVIARNSVFTYKGKPVKVDQIGRELGVRYVLEGSVRRAGEKVRINAQLIDATTGGHLWAERYDRGLKDIFAMQDEVIQKIVAALAVKLTEDEEDHLGYKETHNLEAYDYAKRGWWHYHRVTREANDQARLMFERAIDLEPDFAEAYAGVGFTYYEEWAQLWSQDPRSLERAFELATKAIAMNDSLSGAHTLLSHVYLWRKQYEKAIAEQERAIALDPNNAYYYRDLGEVLIFVGRPEEAIGLVEKAMRLDPHYPATFPFTLGLAYSSLKRYEEAIVAQKRALTRNPDFLGSHLLLAATYIALDRKEEAHNHVVEALRISPQISLDALRETLPVKDQAKLESLLEALREAGLPD
jgi:adenylate cyclase